MTLIDNKDISLINWLEESVTDEIRIATGYFTVSGLRAILSLLPDDGKLKLIASQEISIKGDSLEEVLIEQADEASISEIQQIYDSLENRIVVRVHHDLHAKLYLTGKQGIVGSSNLTLGGLEKNLELNRELHPDAVKEASDWFNDIWEDSEEYTEQIKIELEQSDKGKHLVTPPFDDKSQRRRVYCRVPREMRKEFDDWSLPGKIARLDEYLSISDDGQVPLRSFEPIYTYYQDLLKTALERRSQSIGDIEYLNNDTRGNTRYLWRKYRQADEPCSVPIDPSGKAWLIDWFIEREGDIPDPDYGSRHGDTEEPVLMVNLWQNQLEAIEDWNSSGRNGIIEMATATGKTVVGLAAIADLCGSIPELDGGPKNRDAEVLVVVHLRALRKQWKEEIAEKLDVRMKSSQNEKWKFDIGTATVEVQTPHYISANIDEFNSREYDLVIYDEIHHYSRPEGWGQAINCINSEATLGLSASIGENERYLLEQKLGDVVHDYTLNDAQADGIIPEFDLFFHPVEFTDDEQVEVDNINNKVSSLCSQIKNDERSLSIIQDYGYTIDKSDEFLPILQQVYNKIKKTGNDEELPEEWNQLIGLFRQRRDIEHKSKHAQSKAVQLCKDYIDKGRKVIIFSMRVDETAKPIHNSIDRSQLVHGKQSNQAINRKLDKFKELDSGALVAAKMLDEGIDIPDAEVGINVAGTKTQLQFVQRIGRLLRKEGTIKPNFHHFMMADNERFYRNIAPVPPTAITPNPEVNIEKTLPFKKGTVRVGQIFESLSSEEAHRIATSQKSVTDLYQDSKWWLGILEQEHTNLWSKKLENKIDW